ncbi:ABC transporter permease [Salana multivorans]
MLLRSNLGRSLRTLAALVRLEAMTMANYRWWLVAMQAAGLIVPMVSLLAWRGAIAAGAQAPVTGEYLTTYLVAVSLVTLVTSSWTSGFLADSIRLGTLNGWLVRPCSTHLAAVANNLGEKLAKLVVLAPMVVLVAVVFRSSLDLTSDATTWALFLLALALGGVMAFALDVVVGSLAFWLEDVSGIDRFRAIAIRLLSGAIVPLAALPATWQPFLDAQPFRYLVAFPLEVLLSGADDDGTRVGLFWQAGWTAVLVGVAVLVWRRGLGRYQGGGSMIRVWLALLRQAVMRDLQFRSQAWLNLAAGLAELGVGLVPVLVLESYASDSSGLSTGSGVLIVAFYGIAAGVVDCFVAPGLRRFDVTLRRGEARPRPAATRVDLRHRHPALDAATRARGSSLRGSRCSVISLPRRWCPSVRSGSWLPSCG